MQRRIGFLGALGILLGILTGCMTAPDYARLSAGDIAAQVKVRETPFDRQILVVGPPIAGPLLPAAVTYFVRSGIAKDDGAEWHQFYAEVEYDDYGYQDYKTANFTEGEPRPIKSIYRERRSCFEGSCIREEVLGVNLARADLATGKDLAVRLDARGGDRVVLVIPASYLAAYLAVVDREASRVPAPAADAVPNDSWPARRRQAGRSVRTSAPSPGARPGSAGSSAGSRPGPRRQPPRGRWRPRPGGDGRGRRWRC